MACLEEQTESGIRTIEVDEIEQGQRLDRYLSGKYAGLSRSRLKRLILDGMVLVNGRPSKPSYEIKLSDRIFIQLPEKKPLGELKPERMPLDILHEDDEIVVVNKAPGLIVHPGAGHERGTLVHGLLAHCPHLAAQGTPRRPGIVHRLDKDTSGLLVVAKTDRAYLDLIRQFKEKKVEKEYIALVYGVLEEKRGEIRTLLNRHPVDRKKIAVVHDKGRDAITLWKVEKEWAGKLSLLNLQIKTGRTHQIRVHLSHIRHPIVGDPVYGGGKHRLRAFKSKELRILLAGVERQMLHARRLCFFHPATKERLNLEAPLPADFANLLRQLEATFQQGIEQRSMSL